MINSPERTYTDTGLAGQPQRERDVPGSLSRLDQALDKLESVCARLDPVIGPIPPANPAVRESRTKCQVAEQLDRFTARIEGLIEYVERVEI